MLTAWEIDQEDGNPKGSDPVTDNHDQEDHEYTPRAETENAILQQARMLPGSVSIQPNATSSNNRLASGNGPVQNARPLVPDGQHDHQIIVPQRVPTQSSARDSQNNWQLSPTPPANNQVLGVLRDQFEVTEISEGKENSKSISMHEEYFPR